MQNVKFELQNLADKEPVKEEQPQAGLLRRLWNGVKGVAKATKNTIFWTEETEETAVNPEKLS